MVHPQQHPRRGFVFPAVLVVFAVPVLAVVAGCGGPAVAPVDDDAGRSDDAGSIGAAIPEFGGASRRLTVVATAADGLVTPRDLAFDPFAPERLWVANQALHGVTILTDPGTARQHAETRV